jgi:hypothetical protein
MAITSQDLDDYGPAFVDFTRRAAADAVGPELQRLHAENQHLRQMAQRSQRAEIERTLDREVPNWHEIYATPAFSAWLESPDEYSPTCRSQLLRHAVAKGDAGRVAAMYKGFEREGRHTPAAQRSYQSRQTASSGNVYTRQQIADFYKQRRLGQISDAKWGPLEADIVKAAAQGRVKAAAQGRVVAAINPSDGTEMTRLVR